MTMHLDLGHKSAPAQSGHGLKLAQRQKQSFKFG